MSTAPLPHIKLVSIEKDVCCAHYLCEGEAPDIFRAVDGEWTVQLRDDIDEQALQRNVRCIMWAAKVCPVSAIQVELTDGRRLDGDSPDVDAFL